MKILILILTVFIISCNQVKEPIRNYVVFNSRLSDTIQANNIISGKTYILLYIDGHIVGQYTWSRRNEPFQIKTINP